MIPDHLLWLRRSLIVNSCYAVTANFRCCSLCRYLSSFRCQLFAASTVSRFVIRFIAAYRYLRSPASLSFVARSSMIIIPSSSSFAFSRVSFSLIAVFFLAYFLTCYCVPLWRSFWSWIRLLFPSFPRKFRRLSLSSFVVLSANILSPILRSFLLFSCGVSLLFP